MDTRTVISALKDIGWMRYSSVPVDYMKAKTFTMKFLKEYNDEIWVEYSVQKIGIKVIGIHCDSKKDGLVYFSMCSLPDYFDRTYIQDALKRIENDLFVAKLRYTEKLERTKYIDKFINAISCIDDK